jgi:DNA-binding NtrC family response regulator
MSAANQPIITLLAIDDDPSSLDLISDALEQINLQILTASDAQTGLAIIREKRPEIILMDLLIPGVSGMELLEKIIATLQNLEIILVTGHYSTDLLSRHPKGCKRLHHQAAVDSQSAPANRVPSVSSVGSRCAIDSELLRHRSQGIGRSPAMLDVFARIRRVAPH